jgi:hypothetical protein
MARPKSNEIKYVYDERIEVWADSPEKALLTIRQYGFLVSDPNKLKRGRPPFIVPVLFSNEMERGSK